MNRRLTAGNAAALSRCYLFKQLEPEMLDELIALSRVQRYAAKDVVFLKGDPGDSLYAIVSGRIGITTTSEGGKEIFLNILGPGEVFGEIALLDGKERTAGAMALDPAELMRVDQADFLPFLERNPKRSIRLMRILCERIRWTSDIIEDTIFLDIPHRLAKRLLTLVGQYGKPTREGITIDIKLSQENLGQMLGVTRESVNKGLRALEAQGIIVHEHGSICILDVASLEGLVRLSQER